jgi:hypothetical protein
VVAYPDFQGALTAKLQPVLKYGFQCYFWLNGLYNGVLHAEKEGDAPMVWIIAIVDITI